MRPESSNRPAARALVFYGGFRSRGGGAYMHAVAIEEELTAMGWEVRLVCMDSLPVLVRYLPHLVEKAINLLAMPLGFYYKGRVTRFLYRQFIRERADFYLFEDIYLAWDVAAPAVTVLHAVWSDNLQAFAVTDAQVQCLVRKEAATIAGIAHPIATVSQRYRDYLEKTHFAHSPLARRMEVIELGLDTSRFPAAPRPPDNRSLVYCGALEPRKNVAFMLEVFERIAAADPSASLTIIGDGPDGPRLESQAAARGLNVNFKGRLTHEQVILELQHHAIYLHTSTKESFSFALLEAKLCGLRTCALADLEVPEVFIDEGFASLNTDEWAARILAIDGAPDLSAFPDFSARRMARQTLQLAGLPSPPEPVIHRDALEPNLGAEGGVNDNGCAGEIAPSPLSRFM
jgi:glycosyltransferase involved in cell wall biosynthesis